MHSLSRLFSVMVGVGTFATTGAAWAGDLIDILPDLIPLAIVSVNETAETTRPDLDNPGESRVDTGWVYGTFAPQAELGSIASGAFREFQNLPVGSAVAAFTYQFDPATNVFKRSKQGLGPIFADRAQTIGKGRLNIGVSWSHITFDEIEGTNLDSIPIDTVPTSVFVDTYSDTATGSFDNQAHVRSNTNGVPYPAEGVTYDVIDDNNNFEALISFGDFVSNVSDPELDPLVGLGYLAAAGPEGSYATGIAGPSDLEADVDLQVELMNLYASYGILDNLDVGILLPILHIDMKATVSYTNLIDDTSIQAITQAQLDASTYVGIADVAIDVGDINFCLGEPEGTVGRCLFDLGLSDIYNQGAHDLMNGTSTPSRDNQRAYVRAVTRTVKVSDKDSNSGIGDLVVRGKYKFLESRFIDMAGRLDVAFPTGDEDNFRSTGEYMFAGNVIMSKTLGMFSPHANLAIQMRTGGRENHQFRWMVGVDAKFHERVAASVDFLGSEDFYHDQIGDTQMAIAAGLKINPWKNLVISSAAIIRVNHQGLRADVIPTLGVEYTFF